MSESENQTGKLVVISGPSGAGKSTVVAQLIANCQLPLTMSVSATTRPIRDGEIDGKDYFFISDQQFKSNIESGAFLEYAEVFGRGHWYGTLKTQVASGLNRGDWIILEIDVEGAQQVKAAHPDVVSIFIHPGSLEELERRLRGRATDDQAAIARRLEVAKTELDAAPAYDHIVTNGTVDQAVADICQLLNQIAETKQPNG